ncbi:hypothetical protein ACHAWX_002297 [Stephanocyclus meneghinianus]
MATKISSVWRKYISRILYNRSLKDLIVVQSLARANAARNMAKVMRYERNMAAATVIQAKWRTIMTKNHLVNVRRMVVLLQCFVRKTVASMKLEHLKSEKRRFQAEMATRIASAWKKFHCQSAFKRTVRCVIVCQSTLRHFLAVRTLAVLRQIRDMATATRIETEVRRFLVWKQFMRLKSSAILLQSLVRRRAASRCLDLLKEERRRLEAESVTRISSVWRSYQVRTGYIIVLKAARKHEQRFAAATIIQTQWRAVAGKRRFCEVKSNIILLQSMTRRMLAAICVKKLVSKLKDAANYHSNDYFAYSKKRKEASIRIQAAYRMYTTRKMFVAKKLLSKRLAASMKIQATYRKRHLARTKNNNHLDHPAGVSTAENRMVIVVPDFFTMFLSMISG